MSSCVAQPVAMNADETKGLATVSQPDKGRRRKARRAPRKNRAWKPYAVLTWEERKRIEDQKQKKAEEREKHELALGVPRARHGHNNQARIAPPPAPRITKSSLMDEREERTAVRHLDDVSPDDADVEAAVLSAQSGSEHGSEGELEDFEQAFEECVSDQFQHLSRDELIKRLVDAQEELQTLKAKLASSPAASS